MMFYRHQGTRDPKTITLDTPGLIDGSTLQQEITHLVQKLVDDTQSKKILEKGSFVIAIQGGWGTGKTWASWVMVNHLGTKEGFNSSRFHVFSFELLPFSNINESITNLLSEIAEKLYTSGTTDIRKEFVQMTADATPAREVTAGLNMLGLTLSRKMTLEPHHKKYKDALRKKLKSLHSEGHRFLFMLDELDRLKPDEVTAVIRMVENFRDLPGTIFILPFNRDIIAGSIQESLVLVDKESAHVFLRKFIDASITIKLSLENLKQSFRNEFRSGEDPNTPGAIYSHFKMDTSELVWYILLHIMIVSNTLSAIGNERTGNVRDAHYKNNEASSYLFKLPEFLEMAKKPNYYKSVSSLPYATDGKLKRFADVYGSLSDGGDVNGLIANLQSLLNEQALTGDIFTNDEWVKELREKPEIDHNEPRARTQPHVTVFEAVIMPQITQTAHEPKVTDYYSRRDMEQLANAICNDPNFRLEGDLVEILKRLIAITRERFLEFR
jgi:hypothetical protein